MSSRRAIVLVSAFCAVALLVWWSVAGWSGVDSVAGRSMSVQDTSVVTADDDLPDPLLERSSVNGAEVVTPDATDVRVFRVDVIDAHGAPVPNAEVRFLPPTSRINMPRTAALDREAWLTEHGEVAIADAQGVAYLRAKGDTCICARGEGSYGELWTVSVALGNRVHLRVTRDVTVRVEVVDEEGTPQPHRAVAFHSFFLSGSMGPSGGMDSRFADADGVVTVRHAQVCYEIPEDASSGELHIQCEVHSEVQAERRLSPAELGAEVDVRLVVPQTGTLVVEILDAGGREVRLDSESLRRQFDLRVASPGWQSQGAPCYVDGVARFTGLSVDRQYYVWTRPDPRLQERVCEAHADGQIGAGQTATLQLHAHCCRLRARVVCDPPIPGERLVFLAYDGDVVTNVSYVETEGGVDQCVFLSKDQAAVTAVAVQVQGSEYAPILRRIEGPFEPGTHDLGEIRVGPPRERAIATFEVVTDGGEVVTHDARIDLLDGEDGDERPGCVALEGGRLVAYGPAPTGPMVAVARHPHCLQGRPFAVAPGQHNVLKLRRSACTFVAVRPPAIPRAELSVQLLDEGGKQIDSSTLGDSSVAFFRWRKPGRFHLRIVVGDQVLLEPQPVQLDPGFNHLPRDGGAYDLRGLATGSAFRAESTADIWFEPSLLLVPSGSLDLPAQEAQKWWVSSWYPHLPDRDAILIGRGHVPVRVSRPTGAIAVRMTPHVTLELALPEDESIEKVLGTLVDDGLEDPLLRDVDDEGQHARTFDAREDAMEFAPGSVVEFVVVRKGVAGPPVRVIVTAKEGSGPQVVQLC